MTAKVSAERVHNLVNHARDFAREFEYEPWHPPFGKSHLVRDEMANMKLTKVTTLEYEADGCVLRIHSNGSKAWAEFLDEDEDQGWMPEHLDEEEQKAMTAYINILSQEAPAKAKQPQPQGGPLLDTLNGLDTNAGEEAPSGLSSFFNFPIPANNRKECSECGQTFRGSEDQTLCTRCDWLKDNPEYRDEYWTWFMGASNEWKARCYWPEKKPLPEPGDVITVHRKDGTTSTATIREAEGLLYKPNGRASLTCFVN